MDTNLKSPMVERFLKSFVFSMLLFLSRGTLSCYRIRPLILKFETIEFLWLAYNLLISLLFLIRKRPSIVSMNVLHWTVALLTSSSGFFMMKLPENPFNVSTAVGRDLAFPLDTHRDLSTLPLWK